uniref:PIN-like protein n=1 Tax=Nelumbo nucifera TaxID=4432 RepID=A0A822Z3I0_NELNU|nr:TPA_asm: hypothetical protein HUJ06_006708 [Nelumbo nucifera]
MITGKDIYDVLAAIVPLYVAMILAYGSVWWWKIFTPDQCSDINRFVAIFAVPLLSFHFISSNNPYAMNYRFTAVDSLQKIVILSALLLWQALSKNGSLEWMITFFSLSTLPNTLVMGISLLKAAIGAKLLIGQQFPETAGSITSFRVDSDVVSMNGREPLQAAEIGDDRKHGPMIQSLFLIQVRDRSQSLFLFHLQTKDAEGEKEIQRMLDAAIYLSYSELARAIWYPQ